MVCYFNVINIEDKGYYNIFIFFLRVIMLNIILNSLKVYYFK